MKTTKDYLADLRATMSAKGLNPSKYRMARELNVSDLTVTNWERGRTMDDESAIRVAAYLDVQEGEILAAMAHERAKTPEARQAWEKIARKVGAGAALTLVFALAYAVAPDTWMTAALAFPAVPSAERLYIMLNYVSLRIGKFPVAPLLSPRQKNEVA
jgi:transcriptional regulator with XRE-family HTH domain